MNNKRKVLIVEDELIIAEDIKATLVKNDYEVIDILDNGEAVLEAVEKEQPDLVIMDIYLKGGITGIEAAEQIAKYDIPVIYLTAYSDKKIIEKVKKTSPYGFIIKPFNRRELQIAAEMAFCKHKMEKRLRVSESKYRLLLNQVEEAVLLVGNDSVIKYANKKTQEVFALPEKNIVGANFIEFLNKDSAILFQKELEKVFSEKEVGSFFEISIRNQKNEKRFLRVSLGGFLLRNSGEEPGVLISAMDITKQKNFQAEIEGVNDFLEATINSLPGNFYVFDERGGMIKWNKNLEELFGLSSEEMKEKNIFDFIAPEDRDKAKQEVEKVLRGHDSGLKLKLLTRENKRISHYCTGSKMRIGQDVRVVGSSYDISQQVKNEKLLKESESRYRNIVENIHEVIMLTDSEGVLTYLSSSSEKIFGYNPKSLLGVGFDLAYSDDRDKFQKWFLDVIKNKNRSSLEYRIKTKSEEVKWVIHTCIPIKEDGKFGSILNVIRDITMRVQAEFDIRLKNQELERANKLMVGRELKMIELKQKIKKLEERLEERSGHRI